MSDLALTVNNLYFLYNIYHPYTLQINKIIIIIFQNSTNQLILSNNIISDNI